MNIPKSLYDKMEKLKNARYKADLIEKEILDWFESKGFDTTLGDFTDGVMSYITYGEFKSIEDVQELLQDYIDG